MINESEQPITTPLTDVRKGHIRSNSDNSIDSNSTSEESTGNKKNISSLSEVVKTHALIYQHEPDKNNGKTFLRFPVKEGGLVHIRGILLEPSIVLFENIKAFLKEKLGKDFDSRKIRRHGDRITFDEFEDFESWRAGRLLRIDPVQDLINKKDVTKKAVVIGAGDVGIRIVKELDLIPEIEEIVLLNRDIEYAKQRIKDIKGRKDTKCTTVTEERKEYRAIENADLIFITAGVNVATIGGTSRGNTLKYNIAAIHRYANLIKDAAPNAKIVIVTSPIEQMAKLFQEFSGLPPENIIASGVGLDSIRYSSAIRSELMNRSGIDCEVEAMVIGEHSKNGMIFLRDHIKIKPKNSDTADYLPASYYIDNGTISEELWNAILNESEAKVRNEGIYLANPDHGRGASETPAVAAANVGLRFVFGDEGRQKLSAAIFDPEKNCYIGMPVVFEKQLIREKTRFVPTINQKVHLTIHENTRLSAVANDIALTRAQVSENPLDDLRQSQVLCETLKIEKGISDLIPRLTKIDQSSIESLAASKQPLWEIFEIRADDEKNFIISVNNSYLKLTKQMLEFMDSILRKHSLGTDISIADNELSFKGSEEILSILPTSFAALGNSLRPSLISTTLRSSPGNNSTLSSSPVSDTIPKSSPNNSVTKPTSSSRLASDPLQRIPS